MVDMNDRKIDDVEKREGQKENEYRTPSTSSRDETLNEDGTLPAAVATKLKNPLAGMTKSELLADVEAFAKEKGLEDVLPLLQRGALVAQDPKNFENVTELSEDEKQWLRMETTHRWKQPWMMYFMTSKLITNSHSDFPFTDPKCLSPLCGLSHCAGYGPDCRKWSSGILFRRIRHRYRTSVVERSS